MIGVLQFFFLYASGWTSGLPGVPYSPDEDELLASYGVLEIMISTAIMFGGVLALLKRYRPPPGSFIFALRHCGNPDVGVSTDSSGPGKCCKWSWPGPRPTVLARSLDPDPAVPNRFRAFGLVAPLAVWSIRFIAFCGVPPKSRLAAEIWGGAIVFAGLLGWGLAMLMTLPPSPARA